MKKDSGLYKKIKIYCYIVGLIAFLTAFFISVFLLHNLEKNEKTTGKYMAQITEKRVRARLDQYIILSNLLGNYISAGENLDENTFSELAEKIPNEDGVIKAFELAPEGIITEIYPMLRVLLQTFIRNRKMREPLDWICYRSMSEKRMQLWQGIAENIRLGDHTS